MINELQLLAGTDIPFPEAQVTIHQPTLKELSYLGEDKFAYGYQLLKFSKDILNEQDKINLSNYSDFDILMQVVENKKHESTLSDSVTNMKYVLILLFPRYEVSIENREIVLTDEGGKHIINSDNFAAFKKIIFQIFCIFNSKEEKDEANFNPSGALAQKIADKLRKRHQQLAEQKGKNGKVAILSRYTSILAVGEQKDINSFMNYTMYQLNDEYQRFVLKMNYDMYIKAKLAGAKDVKEPEDWMKDLYDDNNNNGSDQKLIYK